MVSARDLSTDFSILRQAYETSHPGLHRYNTPEEMSRNFEDLRRAWGRDQSLAEAYRALLEFTAKIQCGHSYPNFWNQSQATKDALFAGRNRLPFNFRWMDGKMVVTGGSDVLPKGTVVRAIDGTPTPKILARLLPAARADGANDGKRRRYLEVSGTQEFEAFDIMYPLYFPVGETFDLEVQRLGAGTERVQLAPIDLAERQARRPKVANDAQLGWAIARPREGVAVLTMPDWAVYNTRWNWREFLAETFQRIRHEQVKTLIVDIRGNEGGLDDVIYETLSYLTSRQIAVSGYRRLVRYRQVPSHIRAYADTWDPSFYDWKDRAQPFNDRFFLLDGNRPPRVVVPKPNRFLGRVLVLQNGTNSSATFQFVNLIKSNRIATTIGETTGGNFRGINGGAFLFLRLRRSGLEVDLPLIGTFPNEVARNSGISPDISVRDSVADVAAGRDAAMHRALELAR